MKKKILIIHFNTPHLTECLVRSINLFVEGAEIYIFDNSDSSPFTAEFDNVTVIDNTKGQIINFDEWLKSYPNRFSSTGKVNKWASAKHCYSVEKCMELIDGNFVLLDSDVLLRRDISDFFDDSVACTAEVVMQNNFKIKRILPYVCFINSDMCKKNGVHFFKDDEMHGLMTGRDSERYDTGASFYKHVNKLGIKEIKCNDYIVHYKAGSWVKDAIKYHNYKQMPQEEWLSINKRYWTNERNKNVIYTCITGGYDRLIEPNVVNGDFDYICFTDNTNVTSNVWQIMPLPKETENLSLVKKQRYIKINPHLILPKYEISIWVDGNVIIKGDLDKFVKDTLKDGCSVYVPKHPQRNCIYSEANAVISMRKDKRCNVDAQINRYRKEGFPHKYGLLQSNIMLRRHNDEDCIRLMECWFNEVKDGSHRDQLSFNYASWRNSDINVEYLDKKICKSEFFFWVGGHSKRHATENDYEEEEYDPEQMTYGEQLFIAKNNRRRIMESFKRDFKNRIETHSIGLY